MELHTRASAKNRLRARLYFESCVDGKSKQSPIAQCHTKYVGKKKLSKK